MAKKTQTKPGGDSPAPAAAKATTKKTPAKAKQAGHSASPLIDTNRAAQAAARMLVAGAGSSAPASAAASRPSESAGFKQLKASLQKPMVGGSVASALLGTGAAAKKAGGTGSGPSAGPQVGRGQTFGADVNRSYVPRRTGGG